MNIGKVLIVGAGNLGRQVAFQCAMHGFETVMYNMRPQALESSRVTHRELAEFFTRQRGKSKAEIDAALA